MDAAQLDVLFDRFLALFNQASRRFGELFPYNHLRNATLTRIGSAAIELVVSPERGDPHRRICVVEHGALVRAGDRDRTIGATWQVSRATFDDALERPWAYLAHPEQFDLGWFRARSPHRPRGIRQHTLETVRESRCHVGTGDPRSRRDA